MKTLTSTKYTIILALVVLGLFATYFSTNAANFVEVSSTPPQLTQFVHVSLLQATTTQATSTPLRVDGAKKAQIYFTRSDSNSASTATSTFSVQVSPDEVTWVDYNKLISNVTNSNAQTVTRVGSNQTVGATTTTMYSLDLENDTFLSVRCVANFASTTIVSTDSNTCAVSLEY